MRTLTYLRSMVLRLAKSKSGAVAIEYAFLVALVAIFAGFVIVQWART